MQVCLFQSQEVVFNDVKVKVLEVSCPDQHEEGQQSPEHTRWGVQLRELWQVRRWAGVGGGSGGGTGLGSERILE